MVAPETKKSLGNIIQTIGKLVTLGGICIFGYQIYFWAINGWWPPVSFEVVFRPFKNTAFVSWLYNPQGMFELHKIAHWLFIDIPLALVVFLSGIPIIALGHNLKEEAKYEKPFKNADLTKRHYMKGEEI